ncbi:Cytochrome P450 monooxygenase gliC [Sparassis crispa]|uniref:Cytochrome P450 monooxygenase gliC n=1 Tax=Sparassis crispa TaxID=139825 RepID=A0A401H174_9APHY|nr:Cytochrome P450 monooxygenase gliC [Sparassis crispa]GBE88130.1 Cytochrome P450 monooxygenase gliC [Sparassis crispa]
MIEGDTSLKNLVSVSNVVILTVVVAFSLLLKGVSLHTTLRNLVIGPHDRVAGSKGVRRIPGPAYKWPFGQLEDKFLRGRKKGQEWQALYGDIYRIWSGDQLEVVLTRWQDAAVFYRDAHQHIKPRDSDGGWLFRSILGFGLGLVSEGQWRRLRGHFDPHFSFASISTFVPDVICDGDEYVKQLLPNPAQISRDFHVGNDFKMFGFFLVAKLLFGELDVKQKKALEELIDMHSDIFKLIFNDVTSMIPAARHLPFLRTNRALKKFHHHWLQFNHDAYAKVKGDTNYPITHLWQAMENGSMSEKELLNTVDESLFANVDVSASAVAWSILLTCTLSAHQARLRTEIAENAHDVDGYVRRTDTYLHRTLLETLRVRPVASLIAPESATVDKVLDDGHVIPSGVKVITDVVAVNVRDPFWGADAELFLPDRFETLAGEDVRRHLFTFGFGPRQCLGKYLADKMIKTLLVYMFGRFEGETLPGGKDADDEWKVKVDTFVQLPDAYVRLTRLNKPLV